MPDIYSEIINLMNSSDTLSASTYDTENKQPFICTHPTFFMDGKFHIISTNIAKQTKFYKNKQLCSIICVGDETVKNNLFSRKRLTILCKPVHVQISDKIKIIYQEKFGIFGGGLIDVTDFEAFQLEPIEGLYFRGFGRAYNFTSDSYDVIHLKEPHKPKTGNTMAKILKKSLKDKIDA
jgi:putative heme iron utilization protein